MGRLQLGRGDSRVCAAAAADTGTAAAAAHKLSFVCAAASLLLLPQVRAMVFEPQDSSTCLMLDGEVVPAAPIYLEVHQGLIRVLINPAHRVEPAADRSRQQLA